MDNKAQGIKTSTLMQGGIPPCYPPCPPLYPPVLTTLFVGLEYRYQLNYQINSYLITVNYNFNNETSDKTEKIPTNTPLPGKSVAKMAKVTFVII
jgi:hypothetical protein